MAALWGLLLVVAALSYTATVEAAAIGSDGIKSQLKSRLPVYDDGFMRKLCTFLGASYVRSAKDPQCWYTWCHAGEPYHMQCPPGRSVSPHFYWSSDDPCTEADGQEKCLVGFLKNMHLDTKAEEVKGEEVDEHLDDKQTPVEGKQAPVYKQFDAVEEPLEVTPIEYNEGPQEEVYSEENVVETNDEEPIPEPEPTPEVRRKEPKMVVKQVEQEQSQEGVYYPAHRRSHVVDSFVPQNHNSAYGHFPNYNTYYQHYSPPSYFQNTPPPAPQQSQAEYLRSDDEAPVVYKQPEGRQAPLLQSDPSGVDEEGIPQEPMYDAEDLGADYPQATSNEQDEWYDSEDQPEYEYVDSQQLAPTEKPFSENAVTELPQVTMQRGEAESEEATQEEGDEDIVEGGDDEGEKDPMLYDYFKTHFVEEM